MSAPLRIAVVGCGYWGKKLARTVAAVPDVELVAVCDPHPARVEAAARGLRGGRRTTRVGDVLGDATVDAVALATPVAPHRALGEAALGAGKHLWIEKPLADSVEDADALVSAARALDRRLLVAHTFVSPVKLRRVTMAGTRRMLVYDDVARGPKLRIHDVGADAPPGGEPISYRRGGSWSPRIESAEALTLAAADLAAAVRDERPPVSDGRLGLDGVRALAAAQRSIEKDGVFAGVAEPPAAP